MQIAQFYLGAILTSLYLFIQYDIPAIDLHGMSSLDFEHVNNTFTHWAPVSDIRFKVKFHVHRFAYLHLLTERSYPLYSRRAPASMIVLVLLNKLMPQSATVSEVTITIFRITSLGQGFAALIHVVKLCTSWLA